MELRILSEAKFLGSSNRAAFLSALSHACSWPQRRRAPIKDILLGIAYITNSAARIQGPMNAVNYSIVDHYAKLVVCMLFYSPVPCSLLKSSAIR